jgi:hypothetical protein
MTTQLDDVRGYYSVFDEWGRLDTPEGALEFARAWRIVDKHLTPRARVLEHRTG